MTAKKLSPKSPTRKETSSWGGKREGAGRPKTSPLVAHAPRPRVEKRRCPVHIVLKLRSGLAALRDPELFEVFEKGALRARRFGLRITEFTVRDQAIHLICEFKKSEELEKAFKSLNTALAIAIKKRYKKDHGQVHRGPVFLGRYHMQLLTHPDEMKTALREVLLLPYERDTESNAGGRDLYSSGIIFEKWDALLGSERAHYPVLREKHWGPEHEYAKAQVLRITATPQFWLSQAGWLKSTV